MGASQQKDVTISIYITLNKLYYYGGEIVEGVVHIDCKANRPYNKLMLELHGIERVYWMVSRCKI